MSQVYSVAFNNKVWTLNEGEQWVVLGPMASGKTWLASRLATLYPDEVALVTFGAQAATTGADWMSARYYGSAETYSYCTVKEALSYESVNDINPFEVRPAERKQRSAFKRLRTWVVEVLALEELMGRWTVQLSNGEQRRLMLARAILRQTPVLVLDDPFAGLDITMRAMLHEVLAALVEQGRTQVVMVRHEDEIPQCATHRLKLKEMQIVSQGAFTPKSIAPKQAPTFKRNPPSLKTPVVLDVRDLTLPIDGATLYNGLNWEVHEGERWVVVGPNGSGKTTLFALIIGDSPMSYACDIVRFGKILGPGVPLWSLRSRMAMVSPEAQVYMDVTQTVEAAVFSGLFDREGQRKSPTASQRKQAIRLLTTLGLHERLHATLGTLSAGLVRLVLVVRALVANPDLLLLDELCMNLEVKEQRMLLKLLGRLLAERPKLTVLAIAHRKEHIPAGFNRVLAL